MQAESQEGEGLQEESRVGAEGESMRSAKLPFVGVGIYSVPDAARLSGVAAGRLRRWLSGYEFDDKTGRRHASAALWARELPPTDDEQLLLSFKDLIEARWVGFFRDQRVPWASIRKAAVRASRELGVSHPFSTNRFAAVAGGSRDLPSAAIAENLEGKLRDVLSDQYLLRRVMAPFVRQLEFRGDTVVRWFPLRGSRRVVVDPEHLFGAPRVASGVPTEALWRNHRFGGATYRAIARWWDVPESEVRDAVRWEEQLRAA